MKHQSQTERILLELIQLNRDIIEHHRQHKALLKTSQEAWAKEVGLDEHYRTCALNEAGAAIAKELIFEKGCNELSMYVTVFAGK